MPESKFKTWFDKYFPENSKARKTVGIVLIVIGLLALVTPFTPGSWLAFVGLGLLGIRMSFWEKIKGKFRK
jgi:hypothetical protein